MKWPKAAKGDRPRYRPRRNRLSEMAARNAARPDPVDPPHVQIERQLYPLIHRHPN